MPQPTLITGELRKWTNTGTGDQQMIAGDMYNDMHGIYLDGERRIISAKSIRTWADKGDYFLLRTPGWNLKCYKCYELKT